MVAPRESPAAIVKAERPAHDPTTIELYVHGRIHRADASRLGREVRRLLESDDAQEIVCDLGAVTRSDAAVVDALCRMRLAARRRGCQLRLRNASSELVELLWLVGLTDVMPETSLGVGSGWQTEEGKHPFGVEEERDPADPPV